MTLDERDAWNLIRDANEAWVEGAPGELTEYFHPDMVIAGPDLAPVGRGREAAVASYEDFCRAADVIDFLELEPSVQVVGDTAIVSYAFRIEYEMEGERHLETGRDLFVLARGDDGWLAVWRAVLTAG